MRTLTFLILLIFVGVIGYSLANMKSGEEPYLVLEIIGMLTLESLK